MNKENIKLENISILVLKFEFKCFGLGFNQYVSGQYVCILKEWWGQQRAAGLWVELCCRGAEDKSRNFWRAVAIGCRLCRFLERWPWSAPQ